MHSGTAQGHRSVLTRTNVKWRRSDKTSNSAMTNEGRQRTGCVSGEGTLDGMCEQPAEIRAARFNGI